ncbi:MAG TPA: hypothetical protein VK191_00160 [Symbiobacteriaceae bacterium]|nr:hypothetical protein [Symbiobacteriaceae bacterium]
MQSSAEALRLWATVADLKENDYKSMLAVTSLIDLLIQKGIITREELAARAQHLDAMNE